MNYDPDLAAVQLNVGWWIVRPLGQFGTCGDYPYSWKAIFVDARSEEEALRKAYNQEAAE